MKKQFLIWSISLFSAFFIASCGDKPEEPKAGMSSTEFNKIIDQMVKDKELDETAANNIKNKLKDQEAKNTRVPVDISDEDRKGAITVNSLKLLEDIHLDRSLNLDKYLGKTLLIKDLLIYNVATVDKQGNYVKKVFAYPFNPKNNTIAVSYASYEDYPIFTFKWQYLEIINEIASRGPAFNFELNNPDQMKKINALDWECIEDNNFVYKVDILVKNFSKENFEYKIGDNASIDMKVTGIKINLTGAEIQK